MALSFEQVARYLGQLDVHRERPRAAYISWTNVHVEWAEEEELPGDRIASGWTHGWNVDVNYYPDTPERQGRERAKKLLYANLTEEQKKEYRDTGYFTVVGSNGGIYTIDGGTIGFEGKRLCAIPVISVPIEDKMLAQKLLIEANEDAFLDAANIRSTTGTWIPYREYEAKFAR